MTDPKNITIVKLQEKSPEDMWLAYTTGRALEDGVRLNYFDGPIQVVLHLDLEEMVLLVRALRAFPAIEEATQPAKPDEWIEVS